MEGTIGKLQRTKQVFLKHAVLPQSNGKPDSTAKFVYSGIQLLLEKLKINRVVSSRMIIRVAGDANMFSAPGVEMFFDIGTRNVETTHAILNKLSLKIPVKKWMDKCVEQFVNMLGMIE